MANSSSRLLRPSSSLRATTQIRLVSSIVVTLLTLSPPLAEGAKKSRNLVPEAQQQIQTHLDKKASRTQVKRKISIVIFQTTRQPIRDRFEVLILENGGFDDSSTN